MSYLEHTLILHIPHSSRSIPPGHIDRFLISRKDLNAEMDRLVDYDTEKLFKPIDREDVQLIFPWSRFFMDVERYEEDNDEVMAKIGMGVLYYCTTDGRPLRRPFSPEEREKLLATMYRPWHKQLENTVEEHLSINGSALIIDGHSFPDDPLPCDQDQMANRPDICLGTDEYHTPGKLIHFTRNFFENAGYKVTINRPYKGTIIPLKYYRKDPRVKSLMIEVNRRIYGPGVEESEKTYSDIERFLEEVRRI